MISYRTQLTKIGIQPGARCSYREFFWQPQSLRQAIRSMDAPREFQQATEASIDEGWTEECQGVAWDGAHWIFSSNGSQDTGVIGTIGHMPKALYTFNPNTDFDGDSIVHQFVIAEVKPLSASVTNVPKIPVPGVGWIYHIGHIIYYDGRLYVDHFNEDRGGHIVVFVNNNGALTYEKWIKLKSKDNQRVGLVAINPWDQLFYTCLGKMDISEIYIHDFNGERLVEKTLVLNPPITDGGYVQGGAFSPNGHLYIASGKRDIGRKHQYIYCYSALNGHLHNVIPVLAEESNQELEGICYADITRNNKRVQLHAVLLENEWKERDNIFFKSFATSEPDLV